MNRPWQNKIFLYVMIAIVSIIINLCFQILSVAKYKGIFYIEVSILVGTAAGMPLRYWLEKIYIFSFRARNLLHDGRLFFFYTLMAVFTTFIFWGVEYLFHYLFQSDPMRYLGGLLGLTLGFFIKYQLDKRYVFVSKGQDIA